MTKDQLKQLEKELWNAADNLRANSDLKSSEYAIPVLGLIFLKLRRQPNALLGRIQDKALSSLRNGQASVRRSRGRLPVFKSVEVPCRGNT